MPFPRRSFLKSLAALFTTSQLNSGCTPATPRKEGGVAAQNPQSHAAPKSESSTYDLIVVGGGLSGLACAISAARNGVQVALVHERSMLGGNSASEVRLYPEGNDAYQPWIRESGIHEEFHLEDRVRNHNRYREGLTNCHWDLILYEWAQQQKNLSLFLDTHMHTVTMGARDRIASIHAIQLGTERTYTLSAPLFVDATGDGVLGYRAGADFRWGREARHEYNEPLAPDQADEKVMGNTLFYRAVDTGKPVPFVRPSWAYEYKEESDLYARSHKDIEAGQWWIEVGAPYHPIKDNGQIRHECLKTVLGVWDHIKNKGNHGAENYALEFVGFWPYKREARRIIGDFVLTQDHVQNPQLHDDDVAYGAWGIDIHCQGGILNQKERPFIAPHGANFQERGTLPYGIPLRALYSRNIANLFTVGRNMSCSYVAFASSRVLSTGCIAGQAAGVAAALCKKYNTSPRRIAKDHARECQQFLLRQDCHIIGVENEDPDDLGRTAKVTATSDAPLEVPEPKTPRELVCPRAQLFPVSHDRIDSVSLYLESRRSTPIQLTLGLRPAAHVWDFRAGNDLATAKATLAPRQKGFVTFTFNQKVDPRKLYFVHLPAAPKIFWHAIAVPTGVSHATPPGCSAAQKLGDNATRWEQLGTGHCLAIKIDPQPRPYAADNVTRGTHRPDRWTNLWISQPTLPQHLQLTWPKNVTFNTVLLTFDTNPGRRENAALFRYPDCVKDYRLEARIAGAWKSIAEVKDNYMRRREHTIDAVQADALRMTVLATNGAPTARVYEVRVYKQSGVSS
ncbi:MAG TPA: FAD-dependent oxidoreductase [Tepidisphaeraceae bacterium]|jgi:hypothetical protein